MCIDYEKKKKFLEKEDKGLFLPAEVVKILDTCVSGD